MPLFASRLLAGTFTLSLMFTPLAAHEGWLWAEPFHVAPGASVRLTLNVGEDFVGEARPIVADRVAALHHGTAASLTEELARVPAKPGKSFLDLPLASAGTHVLALDTQPSTLSLPPDKFLAYLQDEGLDQIVRLRQETKQDHTPSRERYRRCVKTLVRVGPASDGTYARRTGQRLEIIPVADPLAAHAGDLLRFRVFFDGQPLASALVCAWHRQDQQLIAVKARTTAGGTVTFGLPHAGPWMISLVQMIPLKNVPDLDWESYWGSLTFELAAR